MAWIEPAFARIHLALPLSIQEDARSNPRSGLRLRIAGHASFACRHRGIVGDWPVFIMKPLRLIVLGALLFTLLTSTVLQAQVYSPRAITKRVVPPPDTNAPPRQPTPPVPGRPTPGTPGAPAVARPLPAPVRIVQPAVNPEKARAAREEAIRKTIEFQKKRAAEGSESAQYELGMRYLKGDGVEKDEATGRKWITLSATKGYGPAKRKVEEFKREALAPAPATPAAPGSSTSHVSSDTPEK